MYLIAQVIEIKHPVVKFESSVMLRFWNICCQVATKKKFILKKSVAKPMKKMYVGTHLLFSLQFTVYIIDELGN